MVCTIWRPRVLAKHDSYLHRSGKEIEPGWTILQSCFMGCTHFSYRLKHHWPAVERLAKETPVQCCLCGSFPAFGIWLEAIAQPDLQSARIAGGLARHFPECGCVRSVVGRSQVGMIDPVIGLSTELNSILPVDGESFD